RRERDTQRHAYPKIDHCVLLRFSKIKPACSCRSCFSVRAAAAPGGDTRARPGRVPGCRPPTPTGWPTCIRCRLGSPLRGSSARSRPSGSARPRPARSRVPATLQSTCVQARPAPFRCGKQLPFAGNVGPMRRIAREWRPAAVVAIAVIAACGRPAGEANTAAGGAGSVGQEVSAEAPARSAGTATARHQTLPLALADGRLLTQVAVPGAGTHWFIIDTAAGRSLISAAQRRTLDVSPDDVSLSSVKGATGSSIMEFVRLPALRVGDATHAK